ncbi:MAG: hydroxymethylbilane synthase [Vicinamibacterales bacterium]
MSDASGPTRLRLGTRGSQLALWQAHAVAVRIEATGGPPCEIVVIKTSGDRLQDAPLSEIGGKRLFVKEIEDALQRGEIDLAVHSSKDMPAQLIDGMTIAAVLPREDPLDAVVLPVGRPASLDSIGALVAVIGQTPMIGTGSVRRVAQLKRLFPGAQFAPIRGNLDTRLRKLDEGQYDALVLAAAGLRRLGFAARIALTLPVEGCVPAPGQGIVAVETRADDLFTRTAVARIDDAPTAAALEAERSLVAALGGGCQTPIGALATEPETGTLELTAAVVALDGTRIVRATVRGASTEARGIGLRVAEHLMAEGASEILADARRAEGYVEGLQP